jgi:hypothetical protein
VSGAAVPHYREQTRAHAHALAKSTIHMYINAGWSALDVESAVAIAATRAHTTTTRSCGCVILIIIVIMRDVSMHENNVIMLASMWHAYVRVPALTLLLT